MLTPASPTPAIDLRGVHLEYRARAPLTLLQRVTRSLQRQRLPEARFVSALSGIDLRIEAGERVGIVGHNGAGKSTLLRVMAGVIPPTRGHAASQGRIHALFDLGLGFEPEASGRENILYRSLLMGERRRDVLPRIDAIADFADLGEFLDLPLTSYSAGMRVRLAFAISTSCRGDILLLDEIIGAGDQRFAEKARLRLMELARSARTLVVASHALSSLSAMCERGVWLRRGRIVADGAIDEVLSAYQSDTADAVVGGRLMATPS